MKPKTTSNNKLFLEILPDFVTDGQIREALSGSKSKLLIENGVKTACIVSSEPVDAKIYLSMVNALTRSGIQVMSLYFDTPDAQHVNVLKAAVKDLKKALAGGGCLIISYRTRFALPLIACIHIANGRSVNDAIETVRKIKKDAEELNTYKGLIEAFKETYSQPDDDAGKIKDAVRIDRSVVISRDAGPDHLRKVPAAGPAVPIPVPAKAEQKPAPAAKPDTSRQKKETTAAAAGAKAGETGEVSNDKKESKKEPGKVKTALAAPVEITEVGAGPFYRSIRFKLISIISLIIFASLTGMIFLASYFFRNDNKIRVQESNLQISEVIALKIKSEIEKYQIMSSVMLKEQKGTTAGEESILEAGRKEVLFTGIARQDEKSGAQKFDKTFYNTPLMNKFLINENDINTINDKKLQALSFSGEHLIINVSPYLDNTVFSLSFPHERDVNGAVKSIIISYIRLENLMKTFATAGITKVFMVNFKGDVIAHPDANVIKSGTNYATLPICSMMMKSKIDNGQTRYKDSKGIYYLGSFKKIDMGGFGIIATADEKKAFEAVYDIQRRNMIIMGIVLTGAILIIFFFGKTITTPIIRLVGATRKIIEGQYHVDIAPTTKDEIGQLTSTFIQMGKGLEEKERIKSAFGKFVNKEIAEAALRDDLRLGGERKTVAILFSDIRQFTAISEKLEPEEVVEFLNIYMTKMVSCIEKSDGIVDKFIGDAIMAVWGTPISKGNDTENAVNSALMMRKELIEFNKGRGGTKKPIIIIGCGINTGTVLAGQIGSENRMEYTVIGDAVNLASRIEQLNKPFGTDILISEDSYKLVKDIFAVEKMKQIKVKGKMEPQQIYAILGRKDDPARPKTLRDMQSLIGIDQKDLLSDDAVTQMIERGEEKYEIIEK
ncbi:MAG: HAMP domain-containing protein [Spirochaetes bacterium]|nr:HAMP domain-containing protein [Spirochaetota bacterium]